MKQLSTVTSVSGGKTSAYLAANYPTHYNVFALVRIEDKNCLFPDKKIRQEVEDRIQKPFIATAEDDMIIYTMLDLEQYLGRKIDWVSGDTFEQIIKKHGMYLPNKTSRFCTTDLKVIPIARWVNDVIKSPVIINFGYRANEVSRRDTMNSKKNENGIIEVKVPYLQKNGRNRWVIVDYCYPEFPLIDDNVYKDSIAEYWKDKEVRFATHNNCVGCWWRHPLFLNKMAQKHTNKMQWFSDQEKNSKGTFKTGITYEQIINYDVQSELMFDDFTDCDSGYCGI